MNSLTKDSFMECARHGMQKPAFICKHLRNGRSLGFFVPDEAPTEEEPWKEAWCRVCEQVRINEGSWNDRSELFAGVMPICEACYEEIRQRNQLA